MDQEKTLQSILETVEFIKDNAANKENLAEFVTKEDLKSELGSLEQRMDGKLTDVKDEIMTQIDKFMVLHQKLDLEMSAYKSRFERLELELQRAISRFEAKS